MRKTNNIFIFLNLKKHSKFFKLFLLFILLFFSVFILTYRLDKNPPGFFIDESIYGYEAFSIIKNKGFSSNGEFLPRFFKNPTQPTRGHSSYVYFNIPFITIFRLKEFSVRLSSVVSSLLLLFTLYFFLKKKIEFFATFLTLFWWPLTAWVFILSRIGLEHIFGTMISFVVFFLLNFIFVENQKNFFNFILLGLFLLFTFYSFQAGKLIGLSYFGLAIILIFLKEKNNKRKISYLSIIGSFFILTLFLSYSYIKDGSFFYRSNELMYYCGDRFIECFIKNIFSHFNWKSYFLNDYRPPDFPVFRHSILGTSLIPKILAPFLIIGIIKLISGLIKKNPESWLTLFSYINGIIPASLTIRGFDSWRSVATLPIIFVLIGFGIDYIFKKIKFIAKKREKIIILLIMIIFVFFGYKELEILYKYEYKIEAAGFSGFHFGAREIVDYYKKNYSKANKFCITPSISYLPDLYIRFFNHGLKKIQICLPSSNSDNGVESNILYAVGPNEVDLSNFMIVKVIFYPNLKDVAFFIIKRKY